MNDDMEKLNMWLNALDGRHARIINPRLWVVMEAVNKSIGAALVPDILDGEGEEELFVMWYALGDFVFTITVLLTTGKYDWFFKNVKSQEYCGDESVSLDVAIKGIKEKLVKEEKE